jgi:hypothetical protein
MSQLKALLRMIFFEYHKENAHVSKNSIRVAYWKYTVSNLLSAFFALVVDVSAHVSTRKNFLSASYSRRTVLA